MTNLKVKKIFDCRNIGQLEDGYPLVIRIVCSDGKGSEYQGWYYPTDDMRRYLRPDGTWLISDQKYNFYQTQLPSGKKCQRKTTVKIQKQIVELVENNKSSVRDLSKYFGASK